MKQEETEFALTNSLIILEKDKADKITTFPLILELKSSSNSVIQKTRILHLDKSFL